MARARSLSLTNLRGSVSELVIFFGIVGVPGLWHRQNCFSQTQDIRFHRVKLRLSQHRAKCFYSAVKITFMDPSYIVYRVQLCFPRQCAGSQHLTFTEISSRIQAARFFFSFVGSPGVAWPTCYHKSKLCAFIKRNCAPFSTVCSSGEAR